MVFQEKSQDGHPEFKKILEKLDIGKGQDFVINRDDVYALRDPPSKYSPAQAFLHKLASLDFRCRKEFFLPKQESEDEEMSTFFAQSDDDDDDDEGDNDDEDEDSQEMENDTRISGADLTLSTIMRCDPFLIQDMFQKMTNCQLAIPLIRPSPDSKDDYTFSLWASRLIKKSWLNYLKENVESNISIAESFNIGFCRVGNLDVSKSGIINNFLSECQGGGNEHSYFSTRETDSKSSLNPGCVEASWFCPNGGGNEKINDLTCCLNLRGDLNICTV